MLQYFEYVVIIVSNMPVLEVQIVIIRILIVHTEEGLSIHDTELCNKAAKPEIISMLSNISPEYLLENAPLFESVKDIL